MTYKIIKHKPGKKEQMKSYINCGRSEKAVEAAVAVFQTLGATEDLDVFERKRVKDVMKTQAASIGMGPDGTFIYSTTKWFDSEPDWKKIGDLSEVKTPKPPFKVHEIWLNNTLVARVHEDHIDVSESLASCTIIPIAAVKAVYHRIIENESGRN